MRHLLFIVAVLYGPSSSACEQLLRALTAVNQAGDHLYEELREGAIVNLGPVPDQDFDVEIMHEDDTPGIYSFTAPRPMKIVSNLPERRVQLEFLDDGEKVIASMFDLEEHARAETADRRLENKFRALAAPAPVFAVGEWVRYRHEAVMRVGKISALKGEHIKIGRRLFDRASVFKTVANKPVNLHIRAPVSRMLKLEADPVGLIFLDHLARWTSQDAFRALPVREQFRLLARLAVAMTPWHEQARWCDFEGLFDIGRLLRQGYGVCRHINPLLAVMIAETGYPVRGLAHANHTWIEVRADGQTWIVDASVRRFESPVTVKRLDDLEGNGVDPRPKFADSYYLQPDRETAYRISE